MNSALNTLKESGKTLNREFVLDGTLKGLDLPVKCVVLKERKSLLHLVRVSDLEPYFFEYQSGILLCQGQSIVESGHILFKGDQYLSIKIFDRMFDGCNSDICHNEFFDVLKNYQGRVVAWVRESCRFDIFSFLQEAKKKKPWIEGNEELLSRFMVLANIPYAEEFDSKLRKVEGFYEMFVEQDTSERNLGRLEMLAAMATTFKEFETLFFDNIKKLV